MKESDITRALLAGAAARGFLCVKQSPQGSNGWPDWLVLADYGVHGFLELKRPGESPTPLQHHRLRELDALGHHATWTDSLAGVKRFLDLLDGHRADSADEISTHALRALA